MNDKRLKMLNEEFKKKIYIIFLYKIQDIRLKSIKITEVIINKDLTYAKIYFVYQIQFFKEPINNIFPILENAKTFIKKNISLMMNIKYIPQLFFLYDKNFYKKIHLINILNKISKN